MDNAQLLPAGMGALDLFYLLLLSASVSVVTAAIKAALPLRLHHLLPLTPLLLGAIGGMLTGLTPAESTGAAAVWGVLAGAFSGQAYEVLKGYLRLGKTGYTLQPGELPETKKEEIK